MKKVIFAYAAESEKRPAMVNELRSTLDGNIEFLDEEDSPANSPVAYSERLLKMAKAANFVVIFFTLEKSGIGHETAGTTALTIHTSSSNPGMTAAERARLPGKPAVLIAVFNAEDRRHLPADLVGFPVYDVSADTSREALLCRLVHEPVKPSTRVREEAASVVLKMVTAGIATLVGANDKTKDFLLDQFGEAVSQTVHYFMAAVVLVLIFAGLMAILRLGANQVGPLLKDKFGARAPRHAGIGRYGLISIAVTLSVLFAYYFFPKPPAIDANLNKHLREWTHQIEESQRPNWGINENSNPRKGVPQAWTTAQSLSGLLSVPVWTNWSSTNVQHAFTFIDRTRIANLVLRSDHRQELVERLALLEKRADFSTLPTNFPNFTMALGVINRIGFGTVVTPELADLLESQRDHYFLSGEPLEGWGYHEQFDWGVTEIAAWVGIAEIQSLRISKPPIWTNAEQRERTKQNVRNIIALLRARQIPQLGAFSPIRDTSLHTYARTYPTVMAIWTMAEAASAELEIYTREDLPGLEASMGEALDWLSASMVIDKSGPKGWLVNPANPTGEDPFLGLTTQTLSILGRVPLRFSKENQEKFLALKKRLLSSARVWTSRSLKPNDQINDRMHDSDTYLYPTAKLIEPSTFLWYPWSVSFLRSLASDPALDPKERRTAAVWLRRLQARAGEYGSVVDSGYNYIAAETLIGFGWPMEVRNVPAL